MLPGFIDTHIHGANGIEFGISDTDVTPAFDWLSMQGVTSILVSFVTESIEEYISDSKKIGAVDDSSYSCGGTVCKSGL